MVYLLDTNVLSEAVRPRPHPAVMAWLTSLDEWESFISAVTIGEIHRGIVTVRDRNPDKAGRLEHWLSNIETMRRDCILSVDMDMCKRWAEFRLLRPQVGMEDLLIAATAAVKGLVLATRNVRDFQNLGIPLFNPFEPAGPPP